jgi:hypothetical protein
MKDALALENSLETMSMFWKKRQED